MGVSPKLRIAWSQDDLHKRTRFERMVAVSWKPVLAAALVALLALVICVAIGVLVADRLLRPPRRAIDVASLASARTIAAQAGGTLSDVSLVARDDAVLKAWSFSRAGRSRGTVIALHGVADSRVSQLGLARLLIDHDYRVLLPDSRAHGASGGEIVTAGALERTDLAMWSEWVRQQHPDECVFATGASLGAAIVLQTLQTTLFCAAVVEAPFLSARSMALYHAGRGWPVPLVIRQLLAGPFIRAGLWYVSVRHGVKLGQADASNAVRGSRVPLLVIVDGADDAVPRRDAERIHAANPRRVTIWTVPEARHTQAWAAAPRAYPARVLDFLGSHQ